MNVNASPPELAVLQPIALAAWLASARDHAGMDRRILAEAATLPCRPPQFSQPAVDVPLFFPSGRLQERYDYPLAPLHCTMIPDAHVVGDKFVVVSHDRHVFADSYWSEANLNDGVHFQATTVTATFAGRRSSVPVVVWQRRQPTREVTEPVALLATPWSDNYHHWLLNSLTRLWRLDESPDVLLIVPGRLTRFQEQSLAALGIAESRLLRFDGGPWHVRRLAFPAVGDFAPQPLQWLRQRLLGDPSGRSPGGRRIYVSRADAAGRHVVNEAEVTRLLERENFEVVRLADLDFRAQASLFAQAELIVGPHGAGLTNILFSPPGATLLELAPRDTVNQVY